MNRKIGNVEINYQFYNSEIHYSDGDIEDVLLDAAQNNYIDKLLLSSNNWAVLYHCSDIRENLLEWYPFKKNASLLEIGSGCGALTGLFARKVKNVTCIELSERRTLINAYRNQKYDNIEIMLGNFQDIEIREKYDYITLIGVWEYAGHYIDGEEPYRNMLKILKKYLKDDGKLLIAIENKTGLKYWNGAPEDHTNKLYSGLNDYLGERTVCTFSKPEIENMLKEVGFIAYKFYYPNPDYKLPDTIYSDDRLPEVGEIRNYRKDYSAPRMYNFNDAVVADQICHDGMYPYFANSFLIECGKNCSDVVYAKYSRLRKEQYRIATIMSKEGDVFKVHKKALNTKAKEHIKNTAENTIGDLPCLNSVDGRMHGEELITDFIQGQSMDSYLYQYRKDVAEFINQVKKMIQTYLSYNEGEMIDFYMTPEFESLFGVVDVKNARCYKETNIDTIFSNLILKEDGKMYCIDNEWVFDFPIPFEFTIWRAASQLYSKYMSYLRDNISKNDFLIAIGLDKNNFEAYAEMEKNFSKNILGENYVLNYRKAVMSMDFKILS